MAAWLLSLWCILLNHPELLLAFACFAFLDALANKNKNNVLVSWPLVGMLPSLLLNVHRLHDWCTQLLRRSGSTFVFHGPWLSGMDLIMTCDPANVRHILCTNFSNFPKGPEFGRIFDVLGDGIFNSDADMWQVQRRMGHTLMNGVKFRRFVAKSTREKLEKGVVPVLKHMVHQGKAFDLQDLVQRFTFDTTCILIFGTDPGSLCLRFPTVAFSKAFDNAMEVLLFRHVVPESWWMLLRRLNIGEEKKLAQAEKIIDHFINQQISIRREGLSKSRSDDHTEGEKDGDISGGDLLTSYISYPSDHRDDETVLSITKSDKFLRDTALNLMLAGRDTTSSALTWFFWQIAKNPRVESKILEELQRLVNNNSTDQRIGVDDDARKFPLVFDAEELSGVVYLQAALCESLRLFPPVPFEHKSALKEDVLPSGETVLPNTKILFSLYAMGRIQGIWGEDCLEFKPERWISERGRLRFEPPYKFMAFNAGPRTCLGKEVAFTQMKAVAATVLYNFHVEVVHGHPVEPKISIILHMKNGLMVRIRERKRS